MKILIVVYTTDPTQAIINAAISHVYKVQNAAFWFAFKMQQDDFLTLEYIHDQTGVPPVNIKLHVMTRGVWKRLKAGKRDQFQALKHYYEVSSVAILYTLYPDCVKAHREASNNVCVHQFTYFTLRTTPPLSSMNHLNTSSSNTTYIVNQWHKNKHFT